MSMECRTNQYRIYSRKRSASPIFDGPDIHPKVKKPCQFNYSWKEAYSCQEENISNSEREHEMCHSSCSMDQPCHEVHMDCTDGTPISGWHLPCSDIPLHQSGGHKFRLHANTPSNRLQDASSNIIMMRASTFQRQQVHVSISCARCCAGESGHIRHIMS